MSSSKRQQGESQTKNSPAAKRNRKQDGEGPKSSASSNAPKIIGVFTYKGGVGKTTTAINLGANLANDGHTVMFADCDTQCNLSTFFNPLPTEQDE
eukprot:4638760-Pyramimonas_sp.AAC.1